MTITAAQGKALTALVHLLRPDWDKPGIEDAIYRARGKGDAAAVCVAAIRAATNSTVRTPGVIPLDGPHWRETSLTPREPPTQIPDRLDHESLLRDRQRASPDPSRYIAEARAKLKAGRQ